MKPEELVRAILLNDTYKKREGISVTTLCDSPQVRHLKEKHADEIQKIIESDPERWRYNAFFGTAIHKMIESLDLDLVQEDALFHEFEGVKLYGTPDAICLKEKILYDFKTCSAWSMLDQPKREWVNQLN